MLSFNISVLSKQVCPAIKPNYAGPGDLIIRPERDNPSEWQETFGEFNWNIPQLTALETLIQTSYDQLVPFSKMTKFQIIQAATNYKKILCSDKGIIVKDYGGEKCTPEWLAMFELSSLLKPMLSRVEQKRGRDFNTLCLGDSDCLIALNHKLKTSHKVDWTWFAYSTDELKEIYPKNWLASADGDYDLASEANIRRIAFDLSKTRIELVVSNTMDNGSIVTCLATLEHGGVAILKHKFENHSISWLWLLNGLFKELLIVKPESSESIWIVGLDYRGIKQDTLENLYNILRFTRGLKVQPQLFKRVDIPDDFIAKLVEQHTIITNIQIESITRTLNNWEHYKDFTPAQTLEANQAEHLHNAKEWLKNNNVLNMSRNAAISI